MVQCRLHGPQLNKPWREKSRCSSFRLFTTKFQKISQVWNKPSKKLAEYLLFSSLLRKVSTVGCLYRAFSRPAILYLTWSLHDMCSRCFSQSRLWRNFDREYYRHIGFAASVGIWLVLSSFLPDLWTKLPFPRLFSYSVRGWSSGFPSSGELWMFHPNSQDCIWESQASCNWSFWIQP